MRWVRFFLTILVDQANKNLHFFRVSRKSFIFFRKPRTTHQWHETVPKHACNPKKSALLTPGDFSSTGLMWDHSYKNSTPRCAQLHQLLICSAKSFRGNFSLSSCSFIKLIEGRCLLRCLTYIEVYSPRNPRNCRNVAKSNNMQPAENQKNTLKLANNSEILHGLCLSEYLFPVSPSCLRFANHHREDIPKYPCDPHDPIRADICKQDTLLL